MWTLQSQQLKPVDTPITTGKTCGYSQQVKPVDARITTGKTQNIIELVELGSIFSAAAIALPR